MTGAWRLNPFTRIQEWVGEFEEPGDDELKEFGYSPRQERPIVHGIPSGRRAHKNRGEPVCEPCRIAYNAATANRRARRKAHRNENTGVANVA